MQMVSSLPPPRAGMAKCHICDAEFIKYHRRHLVCSKECAKQMELRPLYTVHPHRAKLNVGWQTTDEGIEVRYEPKAFAVDKVMPTYIKGIWAVYLIREEYQVHPHGTADSRPFSTTDLELAKIVCDRFSDELKELGK